MEDKEVTLEERLIKDASYFGARRGVRTETLLELLYVATNFGFDANNYYALWEAAYTDRGDITIFEWLHGSSVDYVFE